MSNMQQTIQEQQLSFLNVPAVELSNRDSFEELSYVTTDLKLMDQSDPTKPEMIVPTTFLKHPNSIYFIGVHFHQKDPYGQPIQCGDILDIYEPMSIILILYDPTFHVLSRLVYDRVTNESEKEAVMTEIRRMYYSLPNIKFN